MSETKVGTSCILAAYRYERPDGDVKRLCVSIQTEEATSELLTLSWADGDHHDERDGDERTCFWVAMPAVR